MLIQSTSRLSDSEAVVRVEDLRQREHMLFGFGARTLTTRHITRPGFGSGAPRRSAYLVIRELTSN
jgi:hypothetical protein